MVGGARQWGWVVSVFMVSCVAGQLPLSITPAAPLSRRNIIRNQMRKVLAGNNGYIPILSYLRVRGGGIPPAEQPPRFTTRQSAPPTNARTPYSPDRSRNDPNWIYMVPDINGNLKPVRRKDNLRRLNLPVITPVEPRAPIIDPSLTDVLSNAVDTSSKVSNVAAEGTSRQNPTRTVPIEGIVIDTNGKSNVLNNSPTYSNPAVGTQDRNSLFAATGNTDNNNPSGVSGSTLDTRTLLQGRPSQPSKVGQTFEQTGRRGGPGNIASNVYVVTPEYLERGDGTITNFGHSPVVTSQVADSKVRGNGEGGTLPVTTVTKRSIPTNVQQGAGLQQYSTYDPSSSTRNAADGSQISFVQGHKMTRQQIGNKPSSVLAIHPTGHKPIIPLDTKRKHGKSRIVGNRVSGVGGGRVGTISGVPYIGGVPTLARKVGSVRQRKFNLRLPGRSKVDVKPEQTAQIRKTVQPAITPATTLDLSSNVKSSHKTIVPSKTANAEESSPGKTTFITTRKHSTGTVVGAPNLNVVGDRNGNGNSEGTVTGSEAKLTQTPEVSTASHLSSQASTKPVPREQAPPLLTVYDQALPRQGIVANRTGSVSNSLTPKQKTISNRKSNPSAVDVVIQTLPSRLPSTGSEVPSSGVDFNQQDPNLSGVSSYKTTVPPTTTTTAPSNIIYRQNLAKPVAKKLTTLNLLYDRGPKIGVNEFPAIDMSTSKPFVDTVRVTYRLGNPTGTAEVMGNQAKHSLGSTTVDNLVQQKVDATVRNLNTEVSVSGDGTPLSNEMGLTATRPDVLPGPLVVQNGAWNNPATAGPLNQMQDNSPVRPPLEGVVDSTGWAVPDATALPNTWVPAIPGGETQQRTAEQVPIGAVPEPGLSRPNQPTDLNTGVSLALIRATIMEQAKRLSANNDPNNPNPPAMLNLTAILELIYGPSNSVETVHTANVPTSVDSTNTANAYPYEPSVAVDPVQTPVSSYDATAPIASEPTRGVYVEWSNTPTRTATTYEAHAHPSSGSADPAHTYSNQWPITLTTSNQFLDTTAHRLPSQVPPLPPAYEQAIPATALPTPLQIEVATPPSPVAELPATTEPPLVNISVLGLSTDYGLFDLNMTMNMTTPSVNVTEMTTTASTTPSTTPFGSMNSVCGHHLVNHPDMPPPPTTTAAPVPTTDYYYYYSWFQPPRRPMYRHTQTHAEYEAPEPGEGPAYANGAPTPPPPPGQCICMEKAECEGVGVPQGAPYNYMCDETKGLGCCCEAP